MDKKDLQAEIDRLRGGESDAPWNEATYPTPSQWIKWWNDLSVERRLDVASNILEDAREAQACLRENHYALLDENKRLRKENAELRKRRTYNV